jgi:hypothetical protein
MRSQERFKVCFKCVRTLPVPTAFYRHKHMADGFLNKCKECAKQDGNEHRSKNLHAIREYDRQRGKTQERKKLTAKRNTVKRKDFPIQHAAHQAVQRATRQKVLIKCPCVVCGSQKSMAHHDDYDKPLDVIWLCQVHHKERHKQIEVIRK